jgi:hypothetical protein
MLQIAIIFEFVTLILKIIQSGTSQNVANVAGDSWYETACNSLVLADTSNQRLFFCTFLILNQKFQ